MSLISIIVPLYNKADYLGVCIESVLNQNYDKIEVLLIDDGSTDNSPSICKDFVESDDRVKYFRFDNEGLSVARNRGLDIARGEYIMFVDADDMLYPGAVNELMKIIMEKGFDILQGKTVRDKKFNPYISKKNDLIQEETPLAALESLLYQSGWLSSVCGKLFNRRLFETLRFKPGILYEDLEISYKLLCECKKVGKCEIPVYFYRDTTGSIVNTWNYRRLDVLKVTGEIEEFIRKYYPDILPAANDRRLSANFNMFAFAYKNGLNETAEGCWQVIKDNRKRSFGNSKVRLKNKIGIILSYGGKRFFSFLSRFYYRV